MGYIPKACGFVIGRPSAEGWTYLLLQSRKWDEAGFPKGHVEAGEDELATARRETEEETGLTGLAPTPGVRIAIRYPVTRKHKVWDKEAVYFLARDPGGDLRLSKEHTRSEWLPYAEARAQLPHESLRTILREAALYWKDPALFAAEPQTEADADAWLTAHPDAHPVLVGHLRGAAALARRVASALRAEGIAIHVEAAALGALLHDAGRVLGRHDDHQLAGVESLRTTPFAPYAYACISHFTKGAPREDLLAAGLEPPIWDAFAALVDLTTFTWEERCVALADACMDRDRTVEPAERFASLRTRYPGSEALVDLQERRTAAIRAEMQAILGRDVL